MSSVADKHHNYSEVWRIRATAEQKAKLFEATPPDARGSGTFWREIAVDMAEQFIKLKAGEITVEQLSEWIAKFATEYLLSAKGKPYKGV